MKKIIMISFMLGFHFSLFAQPATLPLKEWPSIVKTPFVLYITGDGGFNSFSNTLCEAISKGGYNISAISSKAYFWDKKTPEQTAAAMEAYLGKQFQSRSNQQLVLVGYSFGADVIPFVINKMTAAIKNKLISVVLISPSTSTDFQIHWSDMFGGNTKRSMNVVAEINKMSVPRISTFFGAEEGTFPVKEILLKNYYNKTLPGGHHFDGHTDELAMTMMKEFK